MLGTMSEPNAGDLLVLTTQIVAAHVGKNQVPAEGLTALIYSVHAALGSALDPALAEPARPEPAVPIKRSVTPDYIVCLECGQQVAILKRHLGARHKMRPETYRARWGLPREYPFVAPRYGERRSALAKQAGLGRSRPMVVAPTTPAR